MSDWVEVLGGLTMILVGAELLVRGAIALALRLRITPTVIGLTVVAVGTSVPEAVVCFEAVQNGVVGMGVGSTIGSNIFNIGAILGVATLLNPLTIESRMLKLEYPFVCVGTLVVYLAALDGTISQLMGGLMLLGASIFFVFLGLHVRKIRRASDLRETEDTIQPGRGLGLLSATACILLGLFLLKTGGDFAVRGSTGLALSWGWSHRMIGLTILAFGTSAPEFAVCAIAAFKKRTDLAIGNIVGSCLFNLMVVLGGAALWEPISLPASIVSLDFPWLVAITIVPLPIMALRFRRDDEFRRLEGALLVGLFLAYYSIILFI